MPDLIFFASPHAVFQYIDSEIQASLKADLVELNRSGDPDGEAIARRLDDIQSVSDILVHSFDYYNFVRSIAHLQLDGETRDGDDPFMQSCDDANETLQRLIRSARATL